MPAATLQRGEVQSPRRRVRAVFIGLTSEKTLWDFSFSCLTQCSLQSVLYLATYEYEDSIERVPNNLSLWPMNGAKKQTSDLDA